MIKPLDQKTILLYGGGQFGWSMIDRVMITWLYTFYITGFQDGSGALMAPLMFGAVFFLGRVVDAVADPLIARYSGLS